MELIKYKSLSEKQKYFQTGDSRIDDLKTFNYIFEHLKNIKKGESIYRGVNEAKYKLYTSAQRYFIENNLEKKFPNYKEFITDLIIQCKTWENGKIPKLLNLFGIGEDNYLSYLSALQHSENPSPCIDFSLNPLVALFFAYYKSRMDDNKEIDNYVSIYMINKIDSPWYFVNLEKPMIDGLKARNLNKNEHNEISLNNEVPFNAFFSIESPLMIEITINEAFKTINTKNIICQEGSLIFNSTPDKPIEILSKERMQKSNIDFCEIKCLNFNKSLKEFALNHLAKEGYTYDSLFHKRQQTSTK